MKKILLYFFLAFSVMAFGQDAFQKQKGAKEMKVQFLGESPKLTKIKAIPSRLKANKSDVYIVPNKLTKTGMIESIKNPKRDPVMQKAVSKKFNESTAIGSVIQGFDGASNDDNNDVNGILVSPPDTQGDVGPNHYFQMTNSVTTIFDKNGNTLFGPSPNSVFFQNLDPRLAGTNDGDPIVLYDQFADRWIVSQFAVDAGAPFAMLIAVSTTPDPLGTYNQYAIEYGTDFPDYPKLGIWRDALYITTRDFANAQNFAGFSIVAINRDDILNGVETTAQRFEIDNPPFDGILPADADGTLLPPEGQPHPSMFMGNGNELNLILTSIDFENPQNSSLEFNTVPVAPFSFFNSAIPQPNGQGLDPIAFFLMYRLQYINFGTHASLLTNHSVQEVSGGDYGIRWYEFRDTGTAPWEVFQQGTYLPNDGLNRWMGSIAMNANGDISLGYSVSSGNLNPSIRFVGQTASQSGSGILNVPEESILEGEFSSAGTNRWGDYSMMSVDPTTQNFWYTTQYIERNSNFSAWGTFISEMELNEPLFAVDPSTISAELTVGDIFSREITVINGDQENVAMVNISTTDNGLPLRLSPEVLNIPPGENITVTLSIDTSQLLRGLFDEVITFDLEGSDLIEEVAVSIRLLDGNEAPTLEVNPTIVDATTPQFTLTTRDLLISNTGDADLNYTVNIEQEEGQGDNDLAPLVILDEGFENFTPGPINGQFDWFAAPVNEDYWIVTPDAAFEGGFGVRGSTENAPLPLASIGTPFLEIDDNAPFTSFSAQMRILGNSGTAEVQLNNLNENGVVTIVRFNSNGSIEVNAVINGIPETVNTGASRPEGFFTLQVVARRADRSFRVILNDQLIYTGIGANTFIQEAFFSMINEDVNNSWDIDNVRILEGNISDRFLTVNPISGTIPFASSQTATVSLDARALTPGTYNATINVESNDPENPSLAIPVSFNVLPPPVIEVSPNGINAAVNTQVDSPAIADANFTISNNGGSPLEFGLDLGASIRNTPEIEAARRANAESLRLLDRSIYVAGSKNFKGEVKEFKVPEDRTVRINDGPRSQNIAFVDSITYDSGFNNLTSFIGFGETVPPIGIGLAQRYDVEAQPFVLTHIRNAYQTDEVENAQILLQVLRGGETPAEAELVHEQMLVGNAPDGVFSLDTLLEPQRFEPGTSFWIVYHYPPGIDFPQGIDPSISFPRPNSRFTTANGGETYELFFLRGAFFTRALSDQFGGFITLTPNTGTVAPGEELTVTASFDGTNLRNGLHETDILINSNDASNPTVSVSSHFEVSGQVSDIAVSEEALLFNDVFVGGNRTRTFTVTNSGISNLEISNISTDNAVFTVDTENATIEGGEVLVITVTFTPEATGNTNGTLIIESNAVSTSIVEVILNGIGVDPPLPVFDPAEVSATTDAGTTIEVPVILRNDGNSPLIFSFPDLAVTRMLANSNIQSNTPQILKFEGFEELDKNVKDTRKGTPVIFSAGTDIDFGYVWIDSDETGGPIFNFEDISEIGTDITELIDGDGTTTRALPFPFEFYGVTYESIFINANGLLSFSEAPLSTFRNRQIPVNDLNNNIIAPFWTDFDPREQGGVQVASIEGRFIVQWTNVVHFDNREGSGATFQVVLYPNGNIDVFYENVNGFGNEFLEVATVGIENAEGTDGAQVVFNAPYIRDGLALRFIRPEVGLVPLISSISEVAGAIAPQESRELTVTLNAEELNEGIFFDRLTASSNAPTEGSALFELTVVGAAEIVLDAEMVEFEPLFIGLENQMTVGIENVGTATLEITEVFNDNSDFEVAVADTSIEPGEGTSMIITFSPSAIGEITDELIISSNDGDNASFVLPLRGIGVDPPVLDFDPEAISLSLNEGESSTEEVVLTNAGGAPLTYSVIPPINFVPEGTGANRVASYDRLVFDPIISKNQPDNRVGQSFRNTSSAPDTFGYTFVDSNNGGPAFDFIDISATGTLADVGGDDRMNVPLPFEFSFYGEVFTDIGIDANGYVSFGAESDADSDFNNLQIPNTAPPNNFIAPMWSDLEPQEAEAGGGVFYQGNEERFIIQFHNTPLFDDLSSAAIFQLILFPDGSFKMQYADVSNIDTTVSTVGIEGPDGTFGLQVVFNSTYLEDNLAVSFTPPVAVGTLAPGESVTVPVNISAEGLDAGIIYTSRILINSSDLNNPISEIPVMLEVLQPAGFELVNADTDEVIAPLNNGDVIDLADFSGTNLNIIFQTGDTSTGSVVFDFNGDVGFRTENFAPYALGGDVNGNFDALELPLGSNTITATPFSLSGGQGEQGSAAAISFEVVRTVLPIEFQLVDADTNTTVAFIADGDIINLSGLGSNFSIEAIVNGVASVVFDFNGTAGFSTENFAPYALAGDDNGDFNAIAIPTGINTLTAKGFSQIAGRGDIIASANVSFEIVRAVPSIVFNLVDADTDVTITAIQEGDVLDLAGLGTNFSIEASVDGVASVVFDFNGNTGFSTENFAPYALGGDDNGNFNAVAIPIGTNTLSANGYSQIAGRGNIIASATISFDVIEGEGFQILAFPNPVNTIVNVAMENPKVQKQLFGTLFNIFGRVVRSNIKLDTESPGNATIDMSNLAQGIYILDLKDDKGQKVGQVKLIRN